MINVFDYLAKILGVDSMMLERLDGAMSNKVGRKGVLDKIAEENEGIITATLKNLDSTNRSTQHILSVLRQTLFAHEKQLMEFLQNEPGKDEFEKAAGLAKKIVKPSKGFFLKKDQAQEILKKRPSENLLRYLKISSIEEVFDRYDVTEIFSSLRFLESDAWMHQTFETAYSSFTASDFEEREVEIRVLGPIWQEVAKKFVAKKLHNVSHLKEFGVIFINPVKENIPGKFLRDFALLFHYSYEIDFYSNLFKKYVSSQNFADNLKMLLRGDIKDIYKVEDGEWLIIQRYLAKENPQDPRLFLPRVNPESLHWLRGERDLALFDFNNHGLDLRLWNNLSWVGGIFHDGAEDVISFDLEDNAMSLVSFMEGRNEIFNYHQKEAMWTKIFSEYAGGEKEMENLLTENFNNGIIKF